MQQVELLVIGGGVAGQAAAVRAAQLGIQTLLVDEGPIPRSWMSRQVPRWYGERLPPNLDESAELGRHLAMNPGISTARELGADVRTGCACWGLFDGRIAGLYDGHHSWFVHAANIILATGSYEQPLAFTGRSLPGVLGGLGALDLLQTQGTLGGERVVVLGSGDFGLEVAQRCLEAGHEVVSIVEIYPEPQGDPALVRDLEQDGVEFIPGHTIVYASGTESVEQIMLGGVDENGRRLSGESFPIRADTLCVAIGRAPSIDLAYLAGCEFSYDLNQGGYYPRHSDTMETTVPGIFVTGDLASAPDASILSPEIAESQGEIAAVSAAEALGHMTSRSAERERSILQNKARQLEQSRSVRSALDASSLWQRASMEVAPDDVVVCRCEGITRADLIREFDVVGDRVPDELKRVSRAGMGECQGRGCRIAIAHLLADRQNVTPANVPLSSFRPPVRPIPMGVLAAIDPPESPLHPEFAELERQIEEEAAAGAFPADRLPSARYKIREENHLSRGLAEAEVIRRVHDLGVTIRTVRVH